MTQIIGWTLIHSFWQIGLIAAIYWLGKIFFKDRFTNALYYLSFAVLSTCLLMVFGTFAYMYIENYSVILSSNSVNFIEKTEAILAPIIASNEGVSSINYTTYLPLFFPYLIAFWTIGMGVFTIRFILSLQKIEFLKKIDNEVVNEFWKGRVMQLQQQLSIDKKVEVFLSKHVSEPLTFGHFKPIILLPISLMTGFDIAAIETILIHELAHIKRNDYAMNLWQSIIEIILFYHPLVWWLSKEIRINREYCCDDMVIELSGNREVYARTLTALQWQKLNNDFPLLALGLQGNNRVFTQRVKRMFGIKEESVSNKKWYFLGLLLLLIGGMTIFQNGRNYNDDLKTPELTDVSSTQKKKINFIDKKLLSSEQITSISTDSTVILRGNLKTAKNVIRVSESKPLSYNQPKSLSKSKLEEPPRAVFVKKEEPNREIDAISIPVRMLKKDTLPPLSDFELKELPTFDSTASKKHSILGDNPSLTKSSKIIYIVDGVSWKEEDLKKISPENILTIDVKKGITARALYGSESVVLIVTKKKKQ